MTAVNNGIIKSI